MKYFAIVLFFSAASCISEKRIDKKLVEGSWRLFDVQQIESSGDDDSFSKAAMLKRDVKVGALFNFFGDGSYSIIKGSGVYEYGKWTLENNNSLIHLEDNKGRATRFPLTLEQNLKGKGLLSFADSTNNVALKFIKESDPLKDFKSDPFYEHNNSWRFKPASPEDSVQLTARMANYIKHTALILKAAQIRKQDVVSFEFSQGPIKIYNGGIGIQPVDLLPRSWKNSFYSEDDAMAAYHQYEKYLQGSHYGGAGVGDWIEDDYNILLSMYADFERNRD